MLLGLSASLILISTRIIAFKSGGMGVYTVNLTYFLQPLHNFVVPLWPWTG